MQEEYLKISDTYREYAIVYSFARFAFPKIDIAVRLALQNL